MNVLIVRPDNLGDQVLFLNCYRTMSNFLTDNNFHKDVKIYITVKDKIVEEFLKQHLTHGSFTEPFNSMIHQTNLTGYFNHFDVVYLPVRSPSDDMIKFVNRINCPLKFWIKGNMVNCSEKSQQLATDNFTSFVEQQRGHELLTHLAFIREFFRESVSIEDIIPIGKDLNQSSFIPPNPTILFSNEASRGEKTLPLEWWVEFFNRINFEIKELILTGTGRSVKLNEELSKIVAKKRNIKIINNTTDKITVPILCSHIKRSNMIIAQETFVAHYASYLRKNLFCILGGGHFGRFMPWVGNDNNNAYNQYCITNKMDCFGCNWHCKYPTWDCIQKINPVKASELFTSIYMKGQRAYV